MQIVFVAEKRAADLNNNEPRGVKTVRAMTVKQSDALFFFRKAQRSVPAIEKQIDLSGVTLIHAHTLFTDGSIAERLAKKRGLPYVVTLRYSDLSAIWKYEPHLRPMARRILRGAARVVCLGSAAREKVLGWFSGAARDALLEEKFCTAMRAGDRYLGRISGTDAMKAFYADCDVLLVPSSAETFGMVYLEAMSQGVPVLYTKGQGFDGQFPEGEIGYAVPCGDVQAQTEALKRVVQEYAQRSQRCVAGAEKYAWPRIAGMWMRLYQEICIEKRGV